MLSRFPVIVILPWHSSSHLLNIFSIATIEHQPSDITVSSDRYISFELFFLLLQFGRHTAMNNRNFIVFYLIECLRTEIGTIMNSDS